METIDIIELLKRVKEGNAPKEIEINENKYELTYEENNIRFLYQNDNNTMYAENITFDTKIKILDKPIIEELHSTDGIHETKQRVNEIIRYINKGSDIE